MIYLGVDWAEAHHDLCLLDEPGAVIAKMRIPDSLDGLRALHELLGEHAEEPGDVVVGIEKDRGLIVTSLVGAGYRVYALNPMSVARYRERHVTSGAKSDPLDARVLADLVRTDRHHHRPVADDRELAQAIKVLARAHQGAIWSRQREANALRNALKDFYPAALLAFGDLAHPDAVEVLKIAPTPPLGRQLSRSKITAALKRGGRQRNLKRRAEEIQTALRSEQLAERPLVEATFGASVSAHAHVIGALSAQITQLEAALAEGFDQHPDAVIVRSLPGMGTVLGARVLGEFGDDPNRFSSAQSRKNYAGTSPVTKSSGKSQVVLSRFARNDRLSDALEQWAFCSTNWSPGARAYYDELRDRHKTHRQSLRQLANRWVGIYHHLLATGMNYDEELAWKHRESIAA